LYTRFLIEFNLC